MPPVTLLGPQRRNPMIKSILDEHQINGRLAVITGGWEEREDELDDLDQHVGRMTLNLHLHRRLQEAFEKDTPFAQAVSDRNDRLRIAQTLYRKRLASALATVRDLYAMTVSRMDLLVSERFNALRAVRYLDEHYLSQIRGIHGAFLELWDPTLRPAFAEVRAQIALEVSDCEAVLIAGGNVGVLLDQLCLLALRPVLAKLPVVAWSAGAMVVCRQIVLFHDSPPQGQSDPEIYDDGLGFAPNVVALPHASVRLALDDERRVSLFAGRFVSATCVALDEGCGVHWDGEGWSPIGHVRRLALDGQVVDLGGE